MILFLPDHHPQYISKTLLLWSVIFSSIYNPYMKKLLARTLFSYLYDQVNLQENKAGPHNYKVFDGRALLWSLDLKTSMLSAQLGPVPLAGSIWLILLIRTMQRDVPADRIVWHVQKRRSKSIQYRGRPSNVLTTVSIRITTAVLKFLAKKTQLFVNMMSLYRNQLHSYCLLSSFKSTDIPD